ATAYGTLTIFVLACLYFLSSTFWKERKTFISAWQRMSSFAKISLKIGTLFFFVLPVLEAHPSKDEYISKVSQGIFSALAEALFLLGIIAFLQHGHTVNKERDENV